MPTLSLCGAEQVSYAMFVVNGFALLSCLTWTIVLNQGVRSKMNRHMKVWVQKQLEVSARSCCHVWIFCYLLYPIPRGYLWCLSYLGWVCLILCPRCQSLACMILWKWWSLLLASDKCSWSRSNSSLCFCALCWILPVPQTFLHFTRSTLWLLSTEW